MQIPWEALRAQNEDFYRMYDVFERESYQVDIAGLRTRYTALHTFDRWLNEGGRASLRKAA